MEKNFEQLYLEHCPDHAFLLTRLQEALNVEEVTFADITTINLTTFKDYLKSYRKANGKLIAASTVKNYLAVFGAFVNDLAADGLIQPVNMKKVGHIKVDSCENIALTEEEVDRFVKYYKSILSRKNHIVERDCLTLFLVEILTGARGSDVEKFTKDNIIDGNLVYVSQKTNTTTRLPAHKMLPMLFDRLPKRQYARTVKNRVVKRIADKLGINKIEPRNYHGVFGARKRCEYIGMHTARRTFITILIDRGVPITTVSKYCGHKDIKMTYRYYQPENLAISDTALAFFNS